MAVFRKKGDDLLPVLVPAVDVDVVRQIDLFRGDVEAGQFQVTALQGIEHAPGAVHIPPQGFHPVFHAGEIQPVPPVGGAGSLVGEVLEQDGIGKPDDDAPFPGRLSDSRSHCFTGAVERLHASVGPQPELQLVLPGILAGGCPGGADDQVLTLHPVHPFQEEEGFEEPMLRAVGRLPAHVRGEAGGIPVHGVPMPVTDQADIGEGARPGRRLRGAA